MPSPFNTQDFNTQELIQTDKSKNPEADVGCLFFIVVVFFVVVNPRRCSLCRAGSGGGHGHGRAAVVV